MHVTGKPPLPTLSPLSPFLLSPSPHAWQAVELYLEELAISEESMWPEGTRCVQSLQ